MAIGFPVKDDYVTGDVLTAANMNDLSGTLNTLAGAEYAAGKNKIINGNFGIWQRGTSFTLAASTRTYTADRFNAIYVGSSQVTTVSQQIFTAGTAPVAGYEGQFFLRYAVTGTTTGNTANQVRQPIEDVRTFAGQTATFSFWAKADTNRALTVYFSQNFGSGGSSEVFTANQTVNITSTWARYSVNVTLPSISGKTIGAGNNVTVSIEMPTATTQTVDFWGWQLEAGSTASDFQTATGTIQGELAACQRYYYRITVTGTNKALATGSAWGTAGNLIQHPFPVTMRIAPTALEQSGTASHYANLNATANLNNCTAVPTFDVGTTTSMGVIGGTASGLVAGNATFLFATSASGFLGWSAEL